ncbi:MAG: PQQ-dependent sugar dehydrogenase [Chloroflexi bacterium]|nr:PQQ-dependent sugar dehydrogenase [Chloroflexota bacterium]
MADRKRRTLLAIAVSVTALVLAVACGGASTTGPTLSAGLPELRLQRVFEDLEFSRLTNLVQAGERFFVTEQTGRVMSFTIRPEPSAAAVFLDIRSQVSTAGNEEGLLGLAFDPDFEANGHFYVYYSAASPRRSVISRFTVSPAGLAEAESELKVLVVPQPFQNHNGGQLGFGPDRMLYIALGDGGSGGDPRGNGQNTSTLLGSILRIDVSGIGPDQGYRVPPGNPFVDATDARGEIWAYGLRNPWRFSFDRENGDLWTGDVGQNSYEEVDLVQRGGNYGWNTLEGAHCFSPRTGCDPTGTLLPVIEYSADKGCSVIGGYVYRGKDIPSLTGTYIYGDFCSGEVLGFRFENGEVTGHSLLIDSGIMITSFGEDRGGEIYVVTLRGGIYLLKADG